MHFGQAHNVHVRRVEAAVGSVLFLALAPGAVVGLVPWVLTHWQMLRRDAWWSPAAAMGAIILAAGLAFLLHAFARFVLEGVGTPAPLAPTERLVVGGMYRYVRNPMYIAVVAAIIGQALLLAQPVLVVYGVVVWLVVAAFARWYEEPTLARRFGADYAAYRAAVPAWLPRLRPWTPLGGSS
jgi:protein-S-isoprenylcysteine O-methyltransferase Ste14